MTTPPQGRQDQVCKELANFSNYFAHCILGSALWIRMKIELSGSFLNIQGVISSHCLPHGEVVMVLLYIFEPHLPKAVLQCTHSRIVVLAVAS